jgi:hypothetical protein
MMVSCSRGQFHKLEGMYTQRTLFYLILYLYLFMCVATSGSATAIIIYIYKKDKLNTAVYER